MFSSYKRDKSGQPPPSPVQQQQAGAQTLITAVNDPRIDARATWWKRGELGGPWGAGEPVLPPLDPYKYPNFKAKDLESYLKVIRVSHKQFLRDRESLAASSHRLPEHGFLAQPLQQQEEHKREHAAEGQLSLAGAKHSPTQGDGLAQALLHVPAQFFNDSFSVEGSALFQDADTPEELQARIEELTSYLDVVEVQLMREVQLRSSSIFDAAGEVDALNQQLCGALNRIKSLRQHLNEVDDHTYASACHVAALQQRRNNVSATMDVLQVVEEVASSRVALQLLLDGQDYAGALDLLEVVAHNMEANCGLGLQMFAQALPQMQETRELLESLLACEFVGLANFSQANAVMEAAILQAAQANTLAAKQEAGDDEACAGLLLEGPAVLAGGAGSAEAEAAVREQLHDKLLPVVLALLRVDRLSGAMQQLHDNYAASTKALIREVLERALNPGGMLQRQQQQQQGGDGGGSGSTTDGAPGGSGDFSVVQALQGLGHEGFLQVLRVVFKVVAACLVHLHQLSSIVRDDILRAAKVPAAASNQVAKDMRAVLQVVADVAQGRWGKLVSARSHCTPRLKLYEFQSLAAICTSFATLLEPHSPRAAAAVRLVALAQCRAYVEALHGRSVAQLQHLLEAEQWTATEVPPTFQDIVNRLVERCSHSTGHTQAATKGSTPPKSAAAPPGSNGGPAGTHQHHHPQSPRTGGLVLHGKRFLLVNTTLMLFKLLDEYLSLADSSPLYCVELGQHVVDLIRLFNTQSCQLVLGAGAVRTAGLRSISAKHLALSCESCYMLAQLIPTLRTVFLTPPPASPLPQQQQQQQQQQEARGGSKPGFAGFEPQRHMLLLEFDKLANDLTVHTREVHSKLVEIMQDRLLLAARQLATEARTWGVVQLPQPPQPLQQQPASVAKDFEVSPAVRSLAKQLSTLQSVLVPILQEEEVHYIFGRVASLYCDTLAATLDVLKPPTLEAAALALQQQQQQQQQQHAPQHLQQQQPPNIAVSVNAGVWEEFRRLNTLYALQSFRVLPLEPSQSATYLTRLSTFYVKHYGSLPSPQASAGSLEAAASRAPIPAAPAAPLPSAASFAPSPSPSPAAPAGLLATPPHHPPPSAAAASPPAPAPAPTPPLPAGTTGAPSTPTPAAPAPAAFAAGGCSAGVAPQADPGRVAVSADASPAAAPEGGLGAPCHASLTTTTGSTTAATTSTTASATPITPADAGAVQALQLDAAELTTPSPPAAAAAVAAADGQPPLGPPPASPSTDVHRAPLTDDLEPTATLSAPPEAAAAAAAAAAGTAVAIKEEGDVPRGEHAPGSDPATPGTADGQAAGGPPVLPPPSCTSESLGDAEGAAPAPTTSAATVLGKSETPESLTSPAVPETKPVPSRSPSPPAPDSPGVARAAPGSAGGEQDVGSSLSPSSASAAGSLDAPAPAAIAASPAASLEAQDASLGHSSPMAATPSATAAGAGEISGPADQPGAPPPFMSTPSAPEAQAACRGGSMASDGPEHVPVAAPEAAAATDDVSSGQELGRGKQEEQEQDSHPLS